MPGFGQSFGQNVGGGGIPYLTGLVPLPDDFLPNDLRVHLTIGVQGSIIDLASTQVFLSSFLAFDGSVPGFTTDFASGSSFVYSGPDNGYTFNILLPDDKLESTPILKVVARTADGTESVQQYSFHAGPDYPPTPFGQVIGEIPLDRFSGESHSGVFSGSRGLVFVSPALIEGQSGSEIDAGPIEVRAMASDPYRVVQTPNRRPFLIGPPPAVPPVNPPAFPPQFSNDYFPVLNDPNFGLLNTRPQIRGEMFDTVSLRTTVILY